MTNGETSSDDSNDDESKKTIVGITMHDDDEPPLPPPPMCFMARGNNKVSDDEDSSSDESENGLSPNDLQSILDEHQQVIKKLNLNAKFLKFNMLSLRPHMKSCLLDTKR